MTNKQFEFAKPQNSIRGLKLMDKSIHNTVVILDDSKSINRKTIQRLTDDNNLLIADFNKNVDLTLFDSKIAYELGIAIHLHNLRLFLLTAGKNNLIPLVDHLAKKDSIVFSCYNQMQNKYFEVNSNAEYLDTYPSSYQKLNSLDDQENFGEFIIRNLDLKQNNEFNKGILEFVLFEATEVGMYLKCNNFLKKLAT